MTDIADYEKQYYGNRQDVENNLQYLPDETIRTLRLGIQNLYNGQDILLVKINNMQEEIDRLKAKNE